MSKVRAAIDIGSNTARLMIAEPSKTQLPWNIKVCHTHITRLGQGVHASHKLQDKAMARTLSVLAEFSELLQEHDVTQDHVLAVATAAIRESANGGDFLKRVAKETGISLCIIDGQEEARLCLQGATAVLLPQFRRDLLLVDIGGGSTEFIRAHNKGFGEAISRKLGAVSLAETSLQSDPPADKDYKTMLEDARQHLVEVEQSWGSARAPQTLAGVAGTFTTLAALHLKLSPYNANQVNNHIISYTALIKLKETLLAMTHKQRAELAYIEEGRADLIIAGLAIIESIMTRWHYTELVTVDASLLEGTWLELGPVHTNSDRSAAAPNKASQGARREVW
ncbi:MAG: hypothetical protein ACE5DY_07885, partial [Mariprofundaceae bacterium]